MPHVALIPLSIALGFLLTPFGLLPSILLFRDLANGTDGSERSKRAYATTLWCGLAGVWVVASALIYASLLFLFG